MTSSSPDTSSVLEGLQRLSISCQELDDRSSAPLGHFQDIPRDIQQSYECILQGANLVHATSTKFTLVGKMSQEGDEANKIAQDLLRGCQLIATGALVVGNNAYGCSRSTRQYTKRAARSVVASVIQLVEMLLHHPDAKVLEKDNTLAAQKCGAVWQTCDQWIQKKVPQGNRNAMRRDLFTWMMECNETMQEFQQMIDRGAAASTTAEENNNDNDNPQTEKHDDKETTFEEFLCQMAAGNQEEQYTAKELEMAKPAVALIKCSRGSINVVLKACESAAKQLTVPAKSKTVLEFLQKAHDLARVVGEGMTDLGTLLYPTISLEDIERQGAKQTQSMAAVLDYVLDSAAAMELDEETLELANKIRPNLDKRHGELQTAIKEARK
ncbi:Phosphatidylserine synthase [Seminavis robusta]|uniref:Phosphatidylserine synthase n=1 Tax=Seminavis robusta TaxID=568900 RepID=A0A9N8DDT5_9STRA|nr:Phosphatidylserine synthase [Seminavis robusta]|eukprot:Sro93_g048270.1 Phosphatidylserine synthase (382) ;mRNA; r:8611-9756